jgi:hypothetical protein
MSGSEDAMRDVVRSFRKDWHRWTAAERLGAAVTTGAVTGAAFLAFGHLAGLVP